MRRSVGSGNVTRPIRSTSFSCDAMLISSNRESLLWSVERRKSWAVSCDIWLLSAMLRPLHQLPPPPPLCCQTSSGKKPAAKVDTTGWGQRSRPSASWLQSSILNFQFFLPLASAGPSSFFYVSTLPLRFFQRRRQKSSCVLTSSVRPSVFI